MTDQLKWEAQAAGELLAFLREQGIDDEEAQDATVESETDLKGAISRALAQHDEAMALCDGAKARIVELGERAARLEARGERIREAIRTALEVAGLKKLQLPECTLSIRAGTASVQVVEESEIPAGYFIERTEWRLDRKKVCEALKSNQAVPGAVLTNPRPSLTIRRA